LACISRSDEIAAACKSNRFPTNVIQWHQTDGTVI